MAAAKKTGVTIPLSTPIEAHGEKLTELTLGDLKLGDLEGVDLGFTESGRVTIDLGCLHRIVAGMAGIPPSSAAKISVMDALAARDAIAGFFGISLPTGGSG